MDNVFLYKQVVTCSCSELWLMEQCRSIH
ncbi:hypothetical protein DCAR_0313658 [Daucus carota subsp. sativus]|uniref:Uncharacterized protein n=1 Tax=Daucus carota subsp. sativus TaxID=79200 RepID=A0AAF1ATD5_DAUCS|nr:hypothetical protein DCAR_0313658 [Daucus carota subsp. sativus]